MNSKQTHYPTLDQFVGNSALTRLQRLPESYSAHASNTLLAKLEGDNPAGLSPSSLASSVFEACAE